MMLINNIDISKFNAKLLSRSIAPANFSISNEWIKKMINPSINYEFYYKYKELEIELDIICSNANELEIIKSNLVKQLAISTIKFKDIDYYYKGFISGDIKCSYIMKGNEIISFSMLVVAEKAEVVETMSRITSKTINVVGNLETPAIIEITPSIDIIDIVLTGLSKNSIKIENLTASKKIILNGEDCKVTELGLNKFGDTNLWSFPSLKPGENTITSSRNNVDITIKYKPRFI
jgi:phage-related protein